MTFIYASGEVRLGALRMSDDTEVTFWLSSYISRFIDRLILLQKPSLKALPIPATNLVWRHDLYTRLHILCYR